MQKVSVDAKNGKYDVLISSGLLATVFDVIGSYHRLFLVSDSNVFPIYGNYFKDIPNIVLQAGEESKSSSNLMKIYEALSTHNMSRQDAVIALGGGVIGDLTGFAAATFKRGIQFVGIPTTLLAQVDSSVGGKVGINLPSGKNMVGSFYQPSVVIADTNTLQTLDRRQFAAGMAEIIKYAFIASTGLYDKLLNNTYTLPEIIQICCQIKADYVKEDPFDLGVRMQLNFGHTIGHAIETITNYNTYLHGEAIAIGMVYAARMGERAGISPLGLEKAVVSLLKQYGLPTEIDNCLLHRAFNLLLMDKKATGDKIHFILIAKIGQAVIQDYTLNEIRDLMYD